MRKHTWHHRDCFQGTLYLQPSENSQTVSRTKAYDVRIKNLTAVKRRQNSPDGHYMKAGGQPMWTGCVSSRHSTALGFRPTLQKPPRPQVALGESEAATCLNTQDPQGGAWVLCSTHGPPWLPAHSPDATGFLAPRTPQPLVTPHPDPCFPVCFRAKTQLLYYLLLKLYIISPTASILKSLVGFILRK